MEVAHGDEDHQHGDRQQRGDDQRTAQLHYHDQDHEDRHQDLQRQRLFQRAQCFVDQLRAVVEGHNGELALGAIGQHLGRQTRCDLRDLLLHRMDRCHGVGAVARDHNTARHFGTALVQQTASCGRPE